MPTCYLSRSASFVLNNVIFPGLGTAVLLIRCRGDDTPGSAPLTRADIPELVKAVADALSRKDPPTLPPSPP